jgi:hypothetical protein
MFLCAVAQTSAAAKMIRFHCVRFIKGCEYFVAERDSHSQRSSILTVNDKLKNV